MLKLQHVFGCTLLVALLMMLSACPASKDTPKSVKPLTEAEKKALLKSNTDSSKGVGTTPEDESVDDLSSLGSIFGGAPSGGSAGVTGATGTGSTPSSVAGAPRMIKRVLRWRTDPKLDIEPFYSFALNEPQKNYLAPDLQPKLFHCPGDSFLVGERSVFKDNDRMPQYACEFFEDEGGNAIRKSNCETRDEKITGDGSTAFKCEGDKLLAGVKSRYDMPSLDRKYAYECCDAKTHDGKSVVFMTVGADSDRKTVCEKRYQKEDFKNIGFYASYYSSQAATVGVNGQGPSGEKLPIDFQCSGMSPKSKLTGGVNLDLESSQIEELSKAKLLTEDINHASILRELSSNYFNDTHDRIYTYSCCFLTVKP